MKLKLPSCVRNDAASQKQVSPLERGEALRQMDAALAAVRAAPPGHPDRSAALAAALQAADDLVKSR